jgi:cytochrome c
VLLGLALIADAGFMAAMSPARAQDAERGKQAFVACATCHSIDGSNGLGPSLRGIVNRISGSVEGFHYSRAMRNAKITWNAPTLNAYLAAPQSVVPGNLMPFSGIADPAQRDDLIAYLESLE